MVGRFDGGRIELEEVRRFPTSSVRLPDGLYWDALGLFGELTSALADVRASGAHVRSVGVDSWGVDFGLLDAQGTLLANPLSYRDGRGAAFVREALDRVPAEEIYATTGIQLLPFNTLFQLLALDAASALSRAETLLLIPICCILADRRAPRGGNEREHDAAARRADRRLGAGSDSGARSAAPDLSVDRAGRVDRRRPVAARRRKRPGCRGRRR